MSRRTERLGSLFQQELATIIQRELTDPRITGFPSVTRVKVAEDLSVADVYVTVMGTPGQQTAALNALRHAAGMMRTILTKELTLRQIPLLKFHIDEQLRKEMEVLRLLGQVEAEKAEMEQRAARQAEIDAVEAAKEAAKQAAIEARRAQRDAEELDSEEPESEQDGDDEGSDEGSQDAGGTQAGETRNVTNEKPEAQ